MDDELRAVARGLVETLTAAGWEEAEWSSEDDGVRVYDPKSEHYVVFSVDWAL